MKVNGKILVVTGGGNGLGKELSLTLLKKGAHVCAVDKNEDALNSFFEELSDEQKSRFHTEVVDLTHEEEVNNLPQKVRERFGEVDGIINNAGIIQPFVKINDLDMKTINRVMNINFYSQIYMIKAFLPYLLKRPESHIVNISSMGGFLPVPGQSIYGASKAAIKLMSEGLYAELISTNVHVTVVFPGAMNTNIAQNSGASVPDIDEKSGNIKMLSPETASEQIIAGVEKNKFQLYIGNDSKTMSTMYRLAPKYAITLIANKMKGLLK